MTFIGQIIERPSEALPPSRFMAVIEKRARVPGFVASGTGAGGH